MTIDASIPLGVKQPQIESPMNALAQALQVQNAQTQNAVGQYGLAKAARQDQETNALANLLRGGDVDLSTPEGQAKAYGVAPTMAPAIIKQQMDMKKTAADTELSGAHAANFRQNTAKAGYDAFNQELGAHYADPNATKQSVTAGIQRLVDGGMMDAGIASKFVGRLPDDPTQLKGELKTALTSRMTPEQVLTAFAPKATEVVNGQQKFFRDTNPNSPTYGQMTAGAPVQMQATPGEVLSSNTSIRTTGMNNAASRANNADMIKKDLLVAGINEDGSSSGVNDSMVDAIGQYKVAPPNGMALRNPRMQQILAQVTQKYPDFDATQYLARQTAAKAFSTGKDAQNVQSANTALNHLDTIEQLATAQKNGNFPLFNQIANTIAAQTGQPAPTNLRAAISMVAPELTKAVVGTGGGVGERADFAHNLNPNGSPEQILQGVGTIKELMGGRLSEVERTYGRTTGRSDFRDSFLSPAAQRIMAARAAASGGGVAPAGWGIQRVN